MALNPTSLQTKIEAELKAQGFILEGEFAKSGQFAAAIAKAVVAEITENAKANITSGSSAGQYPII